MTREPRFLLVDIGKMPLRFAMQRWCFLILPLWLVWIPDGVAKEPSVRLEPCTNKDVPGQVRCGNYQVFENRETGSGRTIQLKIVLLSAESKKEPDPLFILAGGPGQAATENIKFIARTFAQVRRTRDIVLVDQRGTGGSNGLECDLYGATLQGHLGDLFPLDSVRQCAEKWKTQADLRFYTTEIAMADLDEIRAALGYDRINLFGTSYGTRAAQVYLRQYPSHVRSIIMKGVSPITTPLTLPMARDAQRAWDRLCNDCAADSACHAAFPNLKEEFEAVFERLEKGVETEVKDAKGEKEKVKITRAAIAPTIRTNLQSIDSSAELPMRIHEAFQGNYAPLAEATLAVRRDFPKTVSLGVFLGITSIEDVGMSDEKEIADVSKGTFLRDDYFKELQRAAAILPRKKMPDGYRTAVRSEVPTLLISGFLDPATPPGGAEDVAKDLTRCSHVIVRYGSHSYGGMSPCVDTIMATFIARGSVEGINLSCIDQIRRPPFVTGEKRKSEKLTE
jgi:pimeloyl-ACP methyl ester carboxylesterase